MTSRARGEQAGVALEVARRLARTGAIVARRRRAARPCRLSSCAVTLPDAVQLLIDILQGARPRRRGGHPPVPARARRRRARDRQRRASTSSDTPFAFLEQPGLAARRSSSRSSLVVAARQRRRRGRGGPRVALAGIGIGLGALLCAGTLADHGARLVAGADRRRPLRRARAARAARASLPGTRARGWTPRRAARCRSTSRARRCVLAGLAVLVAAARPRSRSASSPCCCAAAAAARARSTRACASCGERRPPQARPDRHRRHEAGDARARDRAGRAPALTAIIERGHATSTTASRRSRR